MLTGILANDPGVQGGFAWATADLSTIGAAKMPDTRRGRADLMVSLRDGPMAGGVVLYVQERLSWFAGQSMMRCRRCGAMLNVPSDGAMSKLAMFQEAAVNLAYAELLGFAMPEEDEQPMAKVWQKHLGIPPELSEVKGLSSKEKTKLKQERKRWIRDHYAAMALPGVGKVTLYVSDALGILEWATRRWMGRGLPSNEAVEVG